MMIIRIIILILLNTTSIASQPISFSGGIGDGYGSITLINGLTFFKGGDDDGFNTFNLSNNQEPYKGGGNDGSTVKHYLNQSVFYTGGIHDGFSLEVCNFYFIWDGSTGSGWNIASNWQTNAVPTYERRVKIPSGVPAYPFLNAGTLKVGVDSGTGTFQAREIIIEAGALMVARINNFIENYGSVCVEGVLEIRNSHPQAFRNMNGAQLIIKNGGQVRTNY